MHRWIRVVALIAPVALFACNNIDIDIDNDNGSGCCCNTCGCNGDGGAGGAATTSSSSSGTGGTPITKCQCPEGYTVTPAGDACFKESQVDPTQHATVYNVCQVDQNKVYGKFGAHVEPGGTAPGGTSEMNSYWGDGSAAPLDGRLNDVGIWACDGTSSTAGTEPLDEWIGFAVCLPIAVSGEYILGIAGDNQVRLDVDGTSVYSDTSSSTLAFNYWHLLPIHLTSGTHIIELRGRNDGQIAAFGAEISGPFAAGALTTDAAVLDETAYAANLLWSTGNLPAGTTFQLGENSGWQCPDQTVLDLCADKPVCKHIEYVSCVGVDPANPGVKDPPLKQQ
ncbi:Hypothetical protein A7982_08460 [Minicystis rosea]|nr:Hypothetical protein A7982_08460 [Minicystis rosea]